MNNIRSNFFFFFFFFFFFILFFILFYFILLYGLLKIKINNYNYLNFIFNSKVNESLRRLYKLHICTKNKNNEIRMSEVFQENLNNALIGG